MAKRLISRVDDRLRYVQVVRVRESIRAELRRQADRVRHFKASLGEKTRAKAQQVQARGQKVRDEKARAAPVNNWSMTGLKQFISHERSSKDVLTSPATTILDAVCESTGCSWTINLSTIDDSSVEAFSANAEAKKQRHDDATLIAGLQKQLNVLNDQRNMCCICMEADACITMVPCGHLCLCRPCAQTIPNLLGSGCPICRGSVSQVIRIY